MITVARLADVHDSRRRALGHFLDENAQRLTPYHLPGFEKVIADVFGYKDFSLVAFSPSGDVVGFVPQWNHAGVLESVPWRDRGGPVTSSAGALQALLEATRQLLRRWGPRAAVWKDCAIAGLPTNGEAAVVEIDLRGATEQKYWDALSNKVRGKVRAARRNGLQSEIEAEPAPQTLSEFYTVFMDNRRRLGVPTYPPALFEAYFQHMPPEQIRLFAVRAEGRLVAGLILLVAGSRAVDAYSASNALGVNSKANDLIVFEAITWCIRQGIRWFDFGADSPRQSSLIAYKTKWGGTPRNVRSSYLGKYHEIDHNAPKYEPAKWVFRRLPTWCYRAVSRVIVR